MSAISNGLISRVAPTIFQVRGKKRLCIMLYHRILPCADYMRPGDPVAEQFDEQMGLIANCFNPMSLADAVDAIEEERLPERAICVTFDDGYADNESVALPILKKWNIPATIFVSTGYLDGGCMWNDSVIESIRVLEADLIDLCDIGLGSYTIHSDSDRRYAAHSILSKLKKLEPRSRQEYVNHIQALGEAARPNLMLTREKLIELDSNGVGIGCHTVDHPILTTVSDVDAFEQIDNGKRDIERILGKKCSFFAYPNGKFNVDFGRVHEEMVKELGFRSAFSTDWGVADRKSNIWRLPRFTPWDRSINKFHVRLLANYRRLG